MRARSLRAAIALALVLTFLRWLVRPLFHEIGRSRSTDLFTLATLLVSLGAAWATHAVGLSMALGAFLAGMLLAETEYRHQLETVIRPFRDVLLGLFFITIGTLLDLQLLFRQLWLVLLLVVGLQIVKTAIVDVGARCVGGQPAQVVARRNGRRAGRRVRFRAADPDAQRPARRHGACCRHCWRRRWSAWS